MPIRIRGAVAEHLLFEVGELANTATVITGEDNDDFGAASTRGSMLP